MDGVSYEVDPALAGETVTLWWGVFDQELFVEQADQQFGHFGPIDGPIPLRCCGATWTRVARELMDEMRAAGLPT